jgi:hypothetical protein
MKSTAGVIQSGELMVAAKHGILVNRHAKDIELIHNTLFLRFVAGDGTLSR